MPLTENFAEIYERGPKTSEFTLQWLKKKKKCYLGGIKFLVTFEAIYTKLLLLLLFLLLTSVLAGFSKSEKGSES